SEYVSKMTGEATTSVSSNSIVIGTNGVRSTSSTGRRYVKTTDEIRRLDKKNLLVFVRDRNVIELRKMDYTENPIYKANKALFAREVSVADHVTKVEKANVNYNSFRFSDIDRSRFVSDMSGRAEDKRKNEPEPNPKHDTTDYRPPSPRSRGPRGL
ncbi:MAG: type IV secretory system conjugative DNA transfer family protein, partial [Ruminococcus sp.]